jgi:fatty acid desaturase
VLADTLRCYALIACGFVLLSWQQPLSWAVAVPAFVLIGTQQYALTILAHDAKHGNLLPSRRLNDLFAVVVLTAPFGADFPSEKARHLDHHQKLGTEDDPDRCLYAASDKATWGSLALFLTGLTTLPIAAERRRSAPGSLLKTRWPVIPAQLLIAAAIVTRWWYYPVFWLAPLYVLMLMTHRMRQFCEHGQAAVPDTLGDGQRLVTFRPGLLERFFLAPFHMSFHAEHHLWPSVPYFNLPRLGKLVEGRGDIEIRRSYCGFVRAYSKRLPLEPIAQRG